MTKEIELKTKVSWLRFKKQNTKKKPNDFICLRWLKKGGGGGGGRNFSLRKFEKKKIFFNPLTNLFAPWSSD